MLKLARWILGPAVALALMIPTARADRTSPPDVSAPTTTRSDVDALQMRRCQDPDHVTWSPHDGTPAPLTPPQCIQLAARVVCAKVAATAPDAATARNERNALAQLLATARIDPGTLARVQHLDDDAPVMARALVDLVHCNEGALDGNELAGTKSAEARALAWAEAAEKAIAAEEKARADVVGPICNAQVLVEETHAAIARERSNPAGVVDLALLHKLGGDLQYYQQQVDQWRPGYAAIRHHPFTGQGEGACTAARAERGL